MVKKSNRVFNKKLFSSAFCTTGNMGRGGIFNSGSPGWIAWYTLKNLQDGTFLYYYYY